MSVLWRRCKSYTKYTEYDSNDDAITDCWQVKCCSCNAETRTFNDMIYRKSNGELYVKNDGVVGAIESWNGRASDEE